MADDVKTTAPADASPPAAQEVSQRTIVILVILTVLLSFIGAWAGISATMHVPAQAPQAAEKQHGSAEVAFVIERPESHTGSATGLVGFEINP